MTETDILDVATAIAGMVESVNRGDMAAAIAAFAAEAVIIEDIAPFCWRGEDAPAQWLMAMAANARKLGVSTIVMELGEPMQLACEGERAYAAYPGRLCLTAGSGNLAADGILILTLARTDGRWLIDTLAWGGPPPSTRGSASASTRG